MAISGKLTKKMVTNLGAGRHGDGNGLYLVVDHSGARRWIVRVVVKGQRNQKGGPLRTDLGLGGVDILSLPEARERALEFRRLARKGIHPKHQENRHVPTFQEFAWKVHAQRLPTWKNAKHGQQWINALRDYAFPKIGRMRVDEIGQPEVLMCLSPVWTKKHETAKRLAQRIRTVLKVAHSQGLRGGEDPVTAIRDAQVLPKVKTRAVHHNAMHWRDLPGFYSTLKARKETAAKALRLTCLTAARTTEILEMRWSEIDFDQSVWTCPAERMKTGIAHRVPLTQEMLSIVEPLETFGSEYVFEGQKRHQPLSNMAMLMLLRRTGVEGATVHGFRSTFRDWAAEVAQVPREVAEKSLAHAVGTNVERAYARSDLLDQRRELMEAWSMYVSQGK